MDDMTEERTEAFLVEILGVAGAGKSTLTSLLQTKSPGYTRAEFIETREPSHLIHVIRVLPRLLPILGAGALRGSLPSWPDFKLIAYVTGWDRLLLRRPEYASGVVLLDQGPIYALVRLKAKGLAVAETRSFQRWWSKRLERWAEVLSLVVWVDAPDETLSARIQGRAQSHAMKTESTDERVRFFGIYRAQFNEIARRLGALGRPDVWHFDSDKASAEAIASRIHSVLADRAAAMR